MNRNKAAVIAHRLNNMPPINEGTITGGRATAFEIGILDSINKLGDYVAELRGIVVEIFNETQDHKHPHRHEADEIDPAWNPTKKGV